MLGIILTGHGQFATGIASSVELIAGKQDNFEVINFEEGDSSDLLNKKLKDAVSRLTKEDDIIIFTDIPGGTPFNQSVIVSQENDRIKVITGTNLPAIMDGLFNRESDIKSFTEKVLESGKDGLVSYSKK